VRHPLNNAIQSLPAKRTQGLRVVTLGCPIGENVGGVDYHQYLGLFDALGQLNAWGHYNPRDVALFGHLMGDP
jgi:hypothetical protein